MIPHVRALLSFTSTTVTRAERGRLGRSRLDFSDLDRAARSRPSGRDPTCSSFRAFHQLVKDASLVRTTLDRLGLPYGSPRSDDSSLRSRPRATCAGRALSPRTSRTRSAEVRTLALLALGFSGSPRLASTPAVRPSRSSESRVTLEPSDSEGLEHVPRFANDLKDPPVGPRSDSSEERRSGWRSAATGRHACPEGEPDDQPGVTRGSPTNSRVSRPASSPLTVSTHRSKS